MKKTIIILLLTLLGCNKNSENNQSFKIIDSLYLKRINQEDFAKKSFQKMNKFLGFLQKHNIYVQNCAPNVVSTRKEVHCNSCSNNNPFVLTSRKMLALSLDTNRRLMPSKEVFSLHTMPDIGDTLNPKEYYLLSLYSEGESYRTNEFLLYDENGKMLQKVFHLSGGGDMGHLRVSFALFSQSKVSIALHELDIQNNVNVQIPTYTHTIKEIYLKNKQVIINTISVSKKEFPDNSVLMIKNINKILIENKITPLE